MRPEQLADAEGRPGDQRPAARRDDPALVGATGEECAHRERERHRQADVAEVEERRVRHHVRVLEARVEPGAVERGHLRRERARHGDEEEREPDRDRGEHRRHPDDEVAGAVAIDPDGERGVPGQDQEPEEQRAFLPAPERRQLVDAAERPVGVVGDVGEREVAAQEPGREHGGRDDRRAEGRDQGVARRLGEPTSPSRGRVGARHGRVQAEAQRDDERRPPELSHLLSGRLGGRVLRRALRHHRARRRDEGAVPELAVDDDVAVGLRTDRERCPCRPPRPSSLDGSFTSRSLKRRPPACESPVGLPTTLPTSETVPVCAASWLGLSDGVPPPAIEV